MHPPVNITSNTTFAADNSMNYTIRLTHGQPFWATIFDKDGASWSSGPYHAGTNQDVGCLATLTGQEFVAGQMPDSTGAGDGNGSGGGVGVAALGGGIAGAFVVGAALAALIMLLLAKRKRKSHNVSPSPLIPGSSLPPSQLPSLLFAVMNLIVRGADTSRL